MILRPACLGLLAFALAAQGSRPSSQAPRWLPAQLGARWLYATGDGEVEYVCARIRLADDTWRVECARPPQGGVSADAEWIEDRGSVTCNAIDRLHRATYMTPLHQDYARTQQRSFSGGLRVLTLPVGITAKWEGTFPLQDPLPPGGDRTAEDNQVRYVAELEAVSERVKVRAGTFAAARVRITEKNSLFGERVSTWWLAPGIGLVKRAGAAGELELVRFSLPDAPPSGELARLVHAALAKHPPWSERGAPSQLRSLDLDALRWTKSRFVRVHWLETSILLRESGGVVGAFDPLAARDWNALLTELQLHVEDPRRPVKPELVTSAALLHASRLGSTPKPVPLAKPRALDLTDSDGAHGTTVSMLAEVDGFVGRRLLVQLTGVFADDSVQDLLVTPR